MVRCQTARAFLPILEFYDILILLNMLSLMTALHKTGRVVETLEDFDQVKNKLLKQSVQIV